MVDWNKVADNLKKLANDSATDPDLLDAGQCAAVAELAERIKAGERAALLADEVGMGKTRIAAALIEAVRKAGGRSAVILPPGLGAQWQQELRRFNANDATLLPLRSYDSFIAGFAQDCDVKNNTKQSDRYQQWINNRRNQRELPQKSWSHEKILMISHSFAAMRFPKGGDGPAGGWRRELLPNVARRVASGRRNFIQKNFARSELAYVHATRTAAEVIAKIIRTKRVECDLSGNEKWLEAEAYKSRILPLIGYGLGQFDLIVVDEAHKARGADSSLSRILGPVTWEARDPFRLGMTATPVELESAQWIDTLGRIHGHDDEQDTSELEALNDWIRGYVDDVKNIQTQELDEALTRSFEKSAKQFREALRPFVLRRDKRHDPVYRSFQEHYGDYRVVSDLAVSPDSNGFTRDWLRRFCAAEALSLLPQNDPLIKRARISVAQGYGFGVGSDDTVEPENTNEVDSINSNHLSDTPHSIWLEALISNPASIYDHPAILEATRLIESYIEQGEKVLVFGKFTKPLNALTRLLDAREMLRRLEKGLHWPASLVHENDKPAVLAALKQRNLEASTDKIAEINRVLAKQYEKWAQARKAELKKLHHEIEALARHDEAAALLVEFLRADTDERRLHGDIGSLLEALESQRTDATAPWSGDEMLRLFKSLLHELTDDDGDDEARGKINDHAEQKTRLRQYLEDYSGREGSYARLMAGKTRAQTRRLLQAAFNRDNSWPMVLVAQSRVGREGLNLHEACRTVVLLHAEWNPGVVEQQIGRVDRKNSRWLKDLQNWESNGKQGDPPRIRIHPVVVRGTYDDHNWQVLKTRWLELRAQLHGNVLPQTEDQLCATPERQVLAERIKQATPSFAPPGLDVRVSAILA